MAQRHLDALSAVDAAFLHQEDSATHMHIGGVAVLTGPPPDVGELRDHIRARLHLVPRYRQKLAVPPAGLGRQRWADDPRFNLDYHVRHAALPQPGSDEQLHNLVARVFSQALDRTKPLWELALVEGLAGGRFALISKTHHALVDGLSGVDLMTTLFDLDPQPHVVEAGEAWVPRPEPSPAQLAAAGLGGAVRRALAVSVRAADAAARPEAALRSARDAVGGLAEVALAGVGSPPSTPLNARIGPHRRFATVPARLADFKAVKDTLGGTVNDVVLAVVAGALRHWLQARGLEPDDVRPRAGVPVSVRRAAEQGAPGNRLTQLMAPLPVDLADPLARLATVRRVMDGVKDSRLALGAKVIAGMQDFAPPTILAQASRLNFSTRFYDLLVTNVPGPQFPLFVLGRRLQAIFPVAFLTGDRALAVAIISYDGGMNFGLIADYDALADLETVAEGVELSLAELVRAARST